MTKLFLLLLLAVSIFTPEVSEAKYCKYYRSVQRLSLITLMASSEKEMATMMVFPARTSVVQDSRLKICLIKWPAQKNQSPIRINNSIVRLT